MKKMNVFIISWYGPFSSQKELQEWEYKQKYCYFLYIFQGKRRKNGRFKYYCGMTYHRTKSDACVSHRINDSDHHIHEFENRHPETITIWVGTFANVSRPKKSDVRLCEKMLTSELTHFELDEKEQENKTNKKPPQETVYIINEWFDINKIIDDDGNYDDYKSRSKDAIPNIVPDVMCYYAGSGDWYRARKLKLVPRL